VLVRARAPLRIDLAGGWTDVAPYAARRGGAVVNVAISRHACAMVRPGGTGIRLSALDLGAVVAARRADELRADGELALLKAVARRYVTGPAEIVTRSTAPAGSGLGGSGAMGVALVAALFALKGDRRLPAEIAAEAFDVETRDAGVLGGKQDQYAAALGGVQLLSFGDPDVGATRLDVPEAALHELETCLVLCYTGATRFSSDTHARVWDAWHRGEAGVAKALDGLKACALAMREALVRGALADVGAVLSENWRCQQALADGMQTSVMARLEEVAAGAGAIGAKACGAGAGGCLVFLARTGAEADVAHAVEAAGGTVLPFTFDARGVVAWRAGE